MSHLTVQEVMERIDNANRPARSEQGNRNRIENREIREMRQSDPFVSAQVITRSSGAAYRVETLSTLGRDIKKESTCGYTGM